MKAKKIFIGMMLTGSFTLASISGANGAIIFTETFGSVTGTTALSSHESANGFDNDSFTYSGSGDLRNNTFSNYSGASGGANVFLTNTVGRNLTISGISTIGYLANSISITFGAFKSTTASNMTELSFEYSTDGSTWSSAASVPTQPTGSGTATWRLVSIPTTNIPISSTLSIRFSNTSASPQFRLDDITLSGTAIPEPTNAVAGLLVACGLFRRSRDKRKI